MKYFKLLLLSLIIVFISGCNINKDEYDLVIITSNFPSYDFARSVVKNNNRVKLEMLVSPGSDLHSFEPTPKDIINIENSDIFIYVGGESEEWVSNILKSINKDKTKIIKLMDLVTLKEEELSLGMEGAKEDEYDEHVWTSIANSIKFIDTIKNTIIEKDVKNKEYYEQNANQYISELKNVDNQIKRIVNNSKRKELVFGDRFPFRYFVDDYGLKYYAAFKGCSEAVEASAKTITFLINKIKEDNIPAVLTIELSNGKIAKEIASETNVKIKVLNSAHNISENDFKNGKTYLDIMKENASVLNEVLN